MAKFGPFKNAFLMIDGNDLSDHVDSVTINHSSATLDEGAMGDETEIQRPGVFSWSIDVNFFQDFDAAEVDVLMWPIHSGRSTVAVKVQPDNAGGAATATNPVYSGNGFISSYTPMGGSHGDELMAPLTMSPRSNLVRLAS